MLPLGKSVENALHCLIYLTESGANAPRPSRTLARLAEYQGVSESSLAKIFTRLTKAGLVRSTVGVGGGFELARPSEEISFWDVVIAVEGGFRLFECREVRAGCVLYREHKEKPDWLVGGTCEIHGVMLEAEAQVKAVLRRRTLAWLARTVAGKVPAAARAATAAWFAGAHTGVD
jgi:Rrf2 family protein